MATSRSKSTLGGKKSKSSKPHSIHVRRGHSGGFVATHHHKGGAGSMDEPEEHVLPDIAALQQHMQDNMGDQPAAAPPQGAPAGGPPMAAPAGAPAGM